MKHDIILKYFPSLYPRQIEQFAALYDSYVEWNNKINVISRKDIDQLYLHHVLHSLAIAKVIDFPSQTSILDFGCGGGFPGIPLAIMFPNSKFHLVDSIGKKLKVVNEISTSLKLENIRTTHTRVEELKDKYDYITCRAVAPLIEVFHWTKYLINQNPDSRWILLKGGDLHQEISDLGKRVELIPINKYFDEEYFKEKYILKLKR